MTKNHHKRKLTDLNESNEAPHPKFRPFHEKAQAEEEHFSELLFNGSTTFLQNLDEAEKEDVVFSSVAKENDDEIEEKCKPAWVDEDDEQMEVRDALDQQHRKLPNGGVNDKSNKYKNLLQHKFVTVYGSQKWASLDKSQKDDSDDESILHSTRVLGNASINYLNSKVLEYKKLNDLNRETYNEGPYINVIEFLSSSTVGLVAGNGRVASLHAIDGKKNSKLHTVGFENYPIFSAKFVQDDTEAILGSRFPYVYSYDLMTGKTLKISLPQGLTQAKKFTTSPNQQYIAVSGKWGEIYLLSARSKERIAVLKQSSNVTDLSFGPNNNLLYSHSDSGEVSIFDIKMNRLRHKFNDEGCLQGTQIRVSSSNQFLATGSAQGVVNIYNVDSLFKTQNPRPHKTILNLTTNINSLEFNSTSEILGLSSVEIPNSVKLYHLKSGTIFQNFPNFQTKLGHVNVVKFSPSSGYLALGNIQSTVALFRLKYFKNY